MRWGMEATTLVAFGITSGDGVVEKRRVKGKVWLEFYYGGGWFMQWGNADEPHVTGET